MLFQLMILYFMDLLLELQMYYLYFESLLNSMGFKIYSYVKMQYTIFNKYITYIN
jgi:hypothetical protein